MPNSFAKQAAASAERDHRDYIDCLVLNAIRGAITLINGEEYDAATDVLRLARDRLEHREAEVTARVAAEARP